MITRQRLSPIMLGLIGIVLAGTVLGAEPHIRSFIVTNVFDTACLPAAVKETGKAYCDFAIVCLQLLLALALGGIFITDDIVNATQRWMANIEEDLDRQSETEQAEIATELKSSFDAVQSAGQNITLGNVLEKMKQLYRATLSASLILGHQIPKWQARLILLRFGSSFPKGIYGMVAFVLFETMLLAQVAKTIFEYHPSCS